MRGIVLLLGLIGFTLDKIFISIKNPPVEPRLKPKVSILCIVIWLMATIIALWLTPVAAQELSQDYQQGFCDGAKSAHEASVQNRDHQRHMLPYPFETYDHAIARIYSLQSKDPCSGGRTVVDDAVCIMLDSIDLYVVLSPWRGGRILTPKGTVDCGEPK